MQYDLLNIIYFPLLLVLTADILPTDRICDFSFGMVVNHFPYAGLG